MTRERQRARKSRILLLGIVASWKLAPCYEHCGLVSIGVIVLEKLALQPVVL
jgi:hypothetical protein